MSPSRLIPELSTGPGEAARAINQSTGAINLPRNSEEALSLLIPEGGERGQKEEQIFGTWKSGSLFSSRAPWVSEMKAGCAEENQISLTITTKPPFYPLFFPPNAYPWFWFLLWLLSFLFECIWKDFRCADPGFSWYVFCHCQPSSVASWATAESWSNGAHWPTVEILQNYSLAFNLLAPPACSVAIIAFGLLEKHTYIQMISG